MSGMNQNDGVIPLDLEAMARFFLDGLRVVAELESEEKVATLADYAQKYEELLGKKPYDSSMLHLLKQIYQPDWKQPELFSYADFDEPIGDSRIPANMYRGEHGLFDSDPE
jgi:hypothetical protein